MNDNVRTALITGLAAVCGGLVAGGAGVATTVVTQNSENARVVQRLDEEARGAARVLVSRFTTDLNFAGEVLRSNRYPTWSPDYVAALSPGDVKRVDGKLSPQGFIDLDIALRDTQTFFAQFREEAGLELAPIDHRETLGLRHEIKVGRDALLSVADLPPYPRSQ